MSALAPREMQVVVGGNTYTVRKMNTEPAALILAKLVKLLGSSLMALGALKNVNAVDDDTREAEQFRVIGDALNDLVARNNPEEVHKLWADILITGYVRKNNVLVNHLNDFDELDELFTVLGVALQLSFGEFIKKQMAKLQGLRQTQQVAGAQQ